MMPSGYTASVLDGTITELKPFALQLARGMGALITMRDEHWDAPIPDSFKPSDYNEKRLEEAKVRHAEILEMTDDECQAAADAEYEKNKSDEAKYLADKAEQRQRYKAMISKVEAWEGAPDGIKEFGLRQLREGMEFDCPPNPKFYREVKTMTGLEWRQAKLEELHHTIKYNAGEHEAECARYAERTAWVRQLKASLDINQEQPQ